MKGAQSASQMTAPGGEDAMLRKLRIIQTCRTLAEYRDRVLEKRAKDVAKDARVTPVSICRVEKGLAPQTHMDRKKYLVAYDLLDFPAEFERMVKAALQPKAQVG